MTKKNAEFDLIIDSSRLEKEYLKDLFRYRELFYFFAWRDILIRYKQTLLGITWSIVRPLINMVIFAFVFGKVANLAADQPDYSLFVLAGMLPWQIFASCLVDSSNCLVQNAPMISKVYFPRVVLPVSNVIVNFADFLISLTMLVVLFAFMRTFQLHALVFLPLFIALSLVLCLGASFWLAAITVRYRDFRFIIPFVVQFGVFISPVGYSSFLIPQKWQWLFFLNPMAGIIEGFRWCFFGTWHADLPLAFILSALGSLFVLATGFRFFRRMERVFADII